MSQSLLKFRQAASSLFLVGTIERPTAVLSGCVNKKRAQSVLPYESDDF